MKIEVFNILVLLLPSFLIHHFWDIKQMNFLQLHLKLLLLDESNALLNVLHYIGVNNRMDS